MMALGLTQTAACFHKVWLEHKHAPSFSCILRFLSHNSRKAETIRPTKPKIEDSPALYRKCFPTCESDGMGHAASRTTARRAVQPPFPDL